MSVSYYAADVRSRLDPSKHEEVTMKGTPQPNVLFVNIGWAEEYDGKHTIQGSHQDIKDQAGNPSVLGEGEAFLPDSTGAVRCVAGMGHVVPNSPIDVVFVAPNPRKHHHEIVGIYFAPSFSYDYWTNLTGSKELWADATTTEFKELPGSRRASIMWPVGRSMRRWVRRQGTIHFAELFDQYVALL